MKRLKKILIAGSAVSSLLLLSACAGTDSSSGGDADAGFKQQTLSVALYTPQDHSLTKTIEAWGEEVTDATGGAVTFDFHYNASILPAADVMQGVADGRADIGLIGAIYYESQLPLTSISGIPFVSDHSKAVMSALNDMYDSTDAMQAEYQANGVRPIFFLPANNALLGHATEPIMSVDDLEGLSIRGAGAFSIALQAAGANPVNMPFNDLWESLERGVIEAFAGVLLDSVETAGLHEVAPFVSNPRLGVLTTYPFSINSDVWNGLSEEVQQIMLDAGEDALTGFYPLEASSYVSSCDAIEDANGGLWTWTEEATAEWTDAVGDEIIQQWRDRVGAGAEEFETDYLALVKEYESSIERPVDGIAECAARF